MSISFGGFLLLKVRGCRLVIPLYIFPVSLDGTFLQINSCRITIGVTTHNSHPAVNIGIHLNRLGKETIRFNIGAGLQIQIVAFADTL